MCKSKTALRFFLSGAQVEFKSLLCENNFFLKWDIDHSKLQKAHILLMRMAGESSYKLIYGKPVLWFV